MIQLKIAKCKKITVKKYYRVTQIDKRVHLEKGLYYDLSVSMSLVYQLTGITVSYYHPIKDQSLIHFYRPTVEVAILHVVILWSKLFYRTRKYSQ